MEPCEVYLRILKSADAAKRLLKSAKNWIKFRLVSQIGNKACQREETHQI